MANTYDIGDLVEMFVTFTDPQTGEPVTPETVACTVNPAADSTLSGGALNPATVATDAPGEFTAEIAPDAKGTWWYAFDGDGGAQASGENFFYVRDRQVPR